MLRTIVFAGAALAAVVSLASAQGTPSLSDPHSLRSQAMKNAGFSAGLGGKMLKGEAPFDARVAQSLLATLNSTNWNKSRAASILGIERSTLDRKIRRYELVHG